MYESYRDHTEETIYINEENDYIQMNYSQFNGICEYEFFHHYFSKNCFLQTQNK